MEEFNRNDVVDSIRYLKEFSRNPNPPKTLTPEDYVKAMNFTPMADPSFFADLRSLYKVGDSNEIYEEHEVPRVDIHEWAKSQGLKISDDGKTITCYKSVIRYADGSYHSILHPNFVYKIGEFAVAENNRLHMDQMSCCSSGLHAGNMKCALDFQKGCVEKAALLELKVDISDPANYVIPYEIDAICADSRIPGSLYKLKPGNKFRFRTCYVVREVTLKQILMDVDTGEVWDI